MTDTYRNDMVTQKILSQGSQEDFRKEVVFKFDLEIEV